MDRTGSSRLQHAASILNVPVSYFFEGGADGPFESPSGLSPSYVDGFVGSEGGLRLIKAFIRVRPATQRRIVALVNEIVGMASKPRHDPRRNQLRNLGRNWSE